MDVKKTIVLAVAGLALAAGPVLAQATPQQQPPPPAGQKPAEQKPAEQKPAPPAPAAPRPFPEGVKFAFIDIQTIATTSIEGKAATAKLDQLRKRKNDEIVARGTLLKVSQDKLQSGGSVMSDAARTQLEREIEKNQREIQILQQDAQTEVNDLTQELQAAFQEKLNPVIEELRVEKGLLMILSVRDSGIVAADAGLDLSAELVKRFDAAAKTAPAKK